MKTPILCALLVATGLTSHAELIRRSQGKFEIQSTIAGKQISQDVYYCGPRRIDTDTRVVIIMHGNQRNADDYRDAWEEHAEEESLLVLVPEFTDRDFPGSLSYNLAGMMNSKGEMTPRDHWAFPLIDTLFLAVKKDQELEAERFYLYGHSAGAQFVHRYAMFANSPRLGLAIAANAGWYTFPENSEGFPYGLPKPESLFNAKRAFSEKLVLLLGSEDTDPNHKYLRKTKEALRQGKHRYERGMNFYASAEKLAQERKLVFNWKQLTAKGVGHSNTGMSKASIKVIKKNDL